MSPRRYSLLLLLALVAASAPLAATAAAAVDDAQSQGDDDDAPPQVVASIEVTLNYGGGGEEEESSEEDDSEDEDVSEEEAARRTPPSPRARAYVYDGEDASIGAFRFAEEYASFNDAKTVVDVARKLTSALPPDYAPPSDVTHCGGKKACSAGKLWKRAEEMRKADMHDAAGADLIRTLLRTGIESDFIAKCEKSLSWSFENIRRQRERERREAEEEAKLEKRRREEEEAMREAEERKKEYEADWDKFRAGLAAAIAMEEGTVGADGTVQVEGGEDADEDPTANVMREFVKEGDTATAATDWDATIRLIKKIPKFDKTAEVLLIEARCHEMLGNPKAALSAAGALVAKAASHEPWIKGTPRMMAATLGANAAMQLGLSENALSFYQTVLKFDPEQEQARKQYRGLKKVVKLMNKAEEQIQKGYNKAASVFVDDCLSAMRGLDVDSPLFRSKIQLKLCTILSGMGKHEEALNNCDSAVEVRIGNDNVVSPESRKEAHLIRAEALLLDMDYDEAVQDFRAASDLVPEDDETGEKRELQHKLQSTMQQQEAWNGGQKDQRFNEHTGYPEGRPPERDHAKILQLPIDLEQRGKEIKCAWLRKQFKLLVRKFHPDKYKGNKKRAARKFKEVTDSKGHLSDVWDC